MLAVAPNCMTRSSLEEMLEDLQRRDESEWQTPPDVPPALPRRAVSRSRLPSAKRRLPVAVSPETDGFGERSEFCMKNGKMRGNGFRDEKDRQMESCECCYVAAAAVEKRIEESAPSKVGSLKDFRQEVVQGTPELQKGLHDCQHLHELNEVAVTFQSYIRGEIARKEYSALLTMKNQEKLDEVAIVQLQSVIRGWLARRRFSNLQKLIQPTHGEVESGISISEVQNLPPDMLALVVGELQKRVAMAEETLELKEKETLELQKRVAMAEETLELKEEENASFREQLQQNEARLKQSEAKMKSTEEMWQKQITSLQMDLAAAEKSAVAKSVVVQPAQPDGGRSSHEGLRPGSNGVKEFVKRKVIFEDDNRAIVGGRWHLVTPIEKLQRLKRMIKAWMKENKVRLRDSKTKIHSVVIRGHGGERKARDH